MKLCPIIRKKFLRVMTALLIIRVIVIPFSTLLKGNLSSSFLVAKNRNEPMKTFWLQNLAQTKEIPVEINQTTIDEDESFSQSLLRRIMNRLRSLPPPPWPQLDHRTSVAIVDGEFIGLNNTDFTSMKNTIVTAYYEFRSKHSVRQYEIWFERILQTSEPMIIFVEPESIWVNFTREHRRHAPTIIATQRFDDLTMVDTFRESFWDYEHSIDTEARIHRGSGVYKLIALYILVLLMLKYLKDMESKDVQMNPFDTDGFVWMDAGYFRKEAMAPKLSTPIVKVNITELGVPRQKVFVLHVRNDGLESNARVNVAGNSYLGTKEAFLTFYFQYFQTLWDWIKTKDKFIGSDQFVLTETCRRYPTNCHPYFAGGYEWWFAFARIVFSGRESNLTTVSPYYIFDEEPPTDLEEVPDGKRVAYCNGTIETGSIYDFSCGN